MTAYTQSQFARLNLDEGQRLSLRVAGDQAQTHWMRVTPEQVRRIAAILDENEEGGI